MAVTVESFEFAGRRKSEFLGTKVEAALLTRHKTGSSEETGSKPQERSRINSLIRNRNYENKKRPELSNLR